MATTRKTAAKAAPKSAGKTAAKATAKKPTAKASAKAPARKTTAKATKPASKTAAKPAARKSSETAAGTKKQPRRSANGFRINEFIVYPAHGVGQIIDISAQEIAGMSLELFVVNFEKEKMVLRVPLEKAKQVGMRKLADDGVMEGAMKTLRGRARVKRTMWSRRAQEYEAKINSGDLVSIAEVTRDLFRADDQPEQSYSERQIFEAASSRLARELAAMEETDEPSALQKILHILNEAAPKYAKVEG